MSSKKVRAWFVDKTKRLGIIEKGTSVVTQDGHTSDWTSITEVKPLKLSPNVCCLTVGNKEFSLSLLNSALDL